MLMLCILLAVAVIAKAVTIRQVIEHPALEAEQYPRIVAAFQKVKTQLGEPLIMLKIVDGGRDLVITANTTIVVRQQVETLRDVEIEFIIAHEAGHITGKHKERRIKLYEKYMEGEVTEQKAAYANARVGREMMALSHQGEYEADLFSLRTLVAMGRTKDEVINAFLNMSRTPDTATHPSTAKRVLNLRNEGAQP
jgi:Zn-dependent protease with chaperone function